MDMKNLMSRIRESAAQYKEALEPPCTETKLARLRDRSRAELAIDIPVAYENFLRIMDGLDFNGVMVYASEQTQSNDASRANIFGFVETNLLHRDVEALNNYLVFGQSDMDIYAMNIKANEYQVLDKVSLDVIASVGTFEELLAKAFESRL